MKFYIALDGDNVGTKLHDLILEGCDEKVSSFARGVANEMANYAACVEAKGAKVLLCSGDSVLYTIDSELAESALECLNVSFCTYTIGVGRTIQEAHLMLNYGKFLGKNRIYRFDSVHPSWFKFHFCGFFISAYKFIFKNK